MKYLGEVISSILVSPGTEKMTYDWVKEARRLPIWYYIGIQLLFDVGILISLRAIPGSRVDEREGIYYASIGKFALLMLP